MAVEEVGNCTVGCGESAVGCDELMLGDGHSLSEGGEEARNTSSSV